MWEYKRLSFNSQSPDQIIQILSELGKEGWEVVQYVEENTARAHKNKDATYLIFLKRKKSCKSYLFALYLKKCKAIWKI